MKTVVNKYKINENEIKSNMKSMMKDHYNHCSLHHGQQHQNEEKFNINDNSK